MASLSSIALRLYREVLKEKNTGYLSQAQIMKLLGSKNEGHCEQVVKLLVRAGRVSVFRGPTGGVMLRRGSGLKGNAPLLKQDIDEIERRVVEEDLYRPLSAFLESGRLFDYLYTTAPRVEAKYWKNADLYGITLASESNGIKQGYFRATAVEVKPIPIRPQDLKQAASYLRFSHYAYLCFFDPSYSRRSQIKLIRELKQAGYWQTAEKLGIGLIVAYHAQKTGADLGFQIIREPDLSDPDGDSFMSGFMALLTEGDQVEVIYRVAERLGRNRVRKPARSKSRAGSSPAKVVDVTTSP